MDNSERTKPKYLFYRIESREDAEIASRQGGGVLLAVGALEAVSISWGSDPQAVAIGFVLLLLGTLVLKRKSRTAAFLAFAISCILFALLPIVLMVVPASSPQFLALTSVLFAIFCAGWRSTQGTFTLHKRYLVTSVRWRVLAKLWIVVVVYTVATAFVLSVIAGPPDGPDPKLAILFLGIVAAVFFLGCLRWLPFTRKLAVLRNETDELDALPF